MYTYNLNSTMQHYENPWLISSSTWTVVDNQKYNVNVTVNIIIKEDAGIV